MRKQKDAGYRQLSGQYEDQDQESEAVAEQDLDVSSHPPANRMKQSVVPHEAAVLTRPGQTGMLVMGASMRRLKLPCSQQMGCLASARQIVGRWWRAGF